MRTFPSHIMLLVRAIARGRCIIEFLSQAPNANEVGKHPRKEICRYVVIRRLEINDPALLRYIEFGALRKQTAVDQMLGRAG